MKKPKILLASSSPYRRQLLQKLGIDFEWDSPNVDESPQPNESPIELVCRLAEAKARHFTSTHPEHIIIGSDQIALYNQQIIGKPHTHTTALTQLQNFSGQEITFITSLYLFNSAKNRSQIRTESYKVRFRKLTIKQIENYLQREQPYDCAGSFKSEGLGICLFEKLEGNDPNTLIGLPLIALTAMLTNEGIDPLDQPTSRLHESN